MQLVVLHLYYPIGSFRHTPDIFYLELAVIGKYQNVCVIPIRHIICHYLYR